MPEVPDPSDLESLEAFYRQVLARAGRDSQTDALIEEAAELIQAICKYRHTARRGEDLESARAAVVEELADLQISLDQARLIYCGDSPEGEREYAEIRRRKLEKLAGRFGIPC